LNIPIIGAGGLYSQANVDTLLAMGAFAVQLDSVLWRGAGYRLFT
jgi:dihydroorotate dehydrogenase